MEIKQLSSDCILIKGKKNSVVVNPREEDRKGNARVLVNGHEKGECFFVGEDKIMIAAPGEYEVGGLEVVGVSLNGKNAFVMTVDGIVVAYMPEGDVEMTEKKEEKLKTADILVGKVENGKVKALWDLAKKLGVNIVVPTGEKEAVIEFLDESDREGQEAVDIIKLAGRTELPESLEVRWLKW